ncbi:MAG TPA: HAD family hydrolase [Gemmatimonadaceae bacterium]|nr:HAD family hydrolase [Gemmatimonadaceae bacterium]
MTAVARAAAFLDRDGTIIDDAHYIGDPDLVRLRPGAADAIARLNRAGIPVIIVTNQSGIARGVLSQADYERVASRMAELLAKEGARIDATYVCPHHPEFGGACDCRKPGTLLFRRAATEHALDLERSTYVGDRWRDVAPGIALGGKPMLIVDDNTRPDEREHAEREDVELVVSLADAVDRIVAR